MQEESNQGGVPVSPEEKPEEKVDENDVEQNKSLAIVGYIIPILFFIPLVTDAKDSKFAKFHANQQLNLLIVSVALSIVGGPIVSFILGITVVLAILVPLIWLAILVALIVLMVMGIVNASNGKMKELPVIGKINLIK